MILVCGENVVDLLPRSHGAPRPVPGGGPANTAVALARLGIPTGFAARIGDDAHASSIRARLQSAGVSDRFLISARAHSATAAVQLDAEGQAEYKFHMDDAADFGWEPADLPSPSAVAETAVATHLGSLAAYLPPGAEVLEEWARRIRSHTILSFDPNFRPVLGDVAAVRERTERYAGLCHLMRVSSADLEQLYRGHTTSEVVKRWLRAGTRLVVVTDGARGVDAYFPGGQIFQPGPTVSVVDTVGAGDTFNAALLAELHRRDALRMEAFADAAADPATLRAALRYAYAASALNCTRAGADPPTHAEVADFLNAL